MNVKVVKKYRKPAYPERELYALRPDLLGASVPSRWLKSKAVMSALIAFILSGTKVDCLANQADKAPITNNAEIQDKEKVSITKESEVKIAPIFIHGDGRGATGCVAISAPVFLPEAEAIDIIFTELKKEHIPFDKRDIILSNLFIEAEEIEPYISSRKTRIAKRPFILHGFDTRHNLGFIFITKSNYFKLGGHYSDSSIQDYNFIDLAINLKEQLAAFNKINAAIFYDPVMYPLPGELKSSCNTNEQCKAFTKKLLEQQVHDFIKWIKIEILPEEKNN